MVLRQDGSTEGDRWGVPAGKCEDGESLAMSMQRELNEETRITAFLEELIYWGVVYVKYPTFDFIFHIFTLALELRPDVVINLKEAKEYKWCTPQEALGMDLVRDEDTCINLVYKI